jgi:hypothetical protein
MKNFLIFPALLLAVMGGEAQAQISDSGNHGLMTISTIKNSALDKVEGSPFLEEEFKYGIAKIEGKDPLKVFVRYNVATEQMEVKTDPNSEEIYMLPPGQHAVYNIDNNIYKYGTLNYEGESLLGYQIEHFAGDQYRLITKHRAEIKEAVKAKTGYDRDMPARIRIQEDLYVIDKDANATKVRAKNRDLKDVFTSPAAKSYLSDHKVRSLKDLVDFIAYLDKQ